MNFQEYLYNFKNVVDKEVEGWFYPKDIIIIVGLLQEILKQSIEDNLDFLYLDY